MYVVFQGNPELYLSDDTELIKPALPAWSVSAYPVSVM